MQQSDYILREIEKISILLMGIMGKLKRKQEAKETVDETDYKGYCEEISENAGFDLDSLFCVAPPGFDSFFKKHHGLDDRNIELLADIMLSMGEISPQPRKKIMLTKALNIYKYLDQRQKTFSMERASNISRTEELLNNI